MSDGVWFDEQRYWLRRFGWLRLDADGVERMHSERDDEAMERYRAYADAVKAKEQAEAGR